MPQNHFEVILENIESRMDHILEILVPMHRKVDQLEEKVDKIVEDLSAVNTGIHIHSQKLAEYKGIIEDHTLSIKKLNQKIA